MPDRKTDPITSVAAFLKRHLPVVRHEPREKLISYVTWYWRDARVGIVRNGPKILAVGLGRALNDPAEGERPWFHDEKGRIVWIDHIVSVHPAGVGLLLQHAMQRFGPRDAFAGHVFKRDGELRMLPWKAVERLVTAQHEHQASTPT